MGDGSIGMLVSVTFDLNIKYKYVVHPKRKIKHSTSFILILSNFGFNIMASLIIWDELDTFPKTNSQFAPENRPKRPKRKFHHLPTINLPV